MNKKAIITSPGDLIKGLFFGFIIGAIIMFLAMKGIINLPIISPAPATP